MSDARADLGGYLMAVNGKLVIVYERGGALFVRSLSKTVDGVWVAHGPCMVIEDSDPGKLGVRVFEALSASMIGVPNPMDWAAVIAPLLAAAGVKNWTAFAKSAKSVRVEASDEIVVTPTRNFGPKGGFQDIDGKARRLSAGAAPPAVGTTILAAIGDCEL